MNLSTVNDNYRYPYRIVITGKIIIGRFLLTLQILDNGSNDRRSNVFVRIVSLVLLKIINQN